MTSGDSGWAWTARVHPGGYQLSFAEGRNLAGPHALSYFEDGAATFACEPLFPRWRHGSDADRFLEPMRAVGLDPDVTMDLDAFDPDMPALDLLTVAFGIRLTEEQMTGPLLTGEVEIDMGWLDR